MALNSLYGFVAGLLLGAGVGGHALRLVVMSADPKAWADRSRWYIAWAGILVYGLGFVLCLLGSPYGPVIAIGFPVVGVTAVLLTGHKIDLFQAVLGVFQFVAAVVAVFALLSR